MSSQRCVDDWSENAKNIQRWVGCIAKYIAMAIISTWSVIDFSHLVIDGAFPASVRKNIMIAVEQQLLELDAHGIVVPKTEEAGLNKDYYKIGSAYLSLFKHYLLDRNLLFKS